MLPRLFSLVGLIFTVSCYAQEQVSESQAVQRATDYASRNFPEATFSPEDARPDDIGSAWLVSYYLPLQKYGGLVRIIVAKETGEVMVGYAADPKSGRTQSKS